MHDWRNEWGYQALLGVVILFNNNFNFQISKTLSDPEGRFIICGIITNGKHLTLANIYVPNDDDPNFFVSVFYWTSTGYTVNFLLI